MRNRWGLVIVAMIAALAACMGSDDGGDAPVAVANVVGRAGDEAREALEGQGLKVRYEDRAEGRAVLMAGNWQVVDQEPAAGTSVSDDTVVTLGVKKPGDDERQIAEASRDAAVAVKIDELRRYLDEGFKETSWYPHIIELRRFESTTVVEAVTNSASAARGICQGVSGFVFANRQDVLTGVRVAAPTGESYVVRASIGDSCELD